MSTHLSDSLIEEISALAQGLLEPNFANSRCPEEFSKQDFAGALEQIERSMAEEPECLELRLWWTLAHAELSQVPLSALCSPLEERFGKFQAEQSLHKLTCASFLKLALALLKRGQYQLGVLMLERAWHFVKSDQDLIQEKILIEDSLESVLKGEIERQQDKKGTRRYVQGLKEKLGSLKEAKEVRPPVQSSTLEEVEQEVEFSAAESSESLEEEKDEADDLSVIAQGRRRARSASWLWVTGLAVLLILLVGYYGAVSLTTDASKEIASKNSESLPLPPQEIARLEIEKVEKTPTQDLEAPKIETGESSLDLSLTKLQKRLENINLESDVSVDPIEEPSLESSPALDGVLTDSGTTVEMGKEQNRFGEKKGEVQVDQDKLPSTDESVLAKTEVQQMDDSPKRDFVGKYVYGSDGRLYGPPLTDKDKAAQGKTLDGRPLRAYQVQEFSGERVYRTISPTKVMSAPSVMAKSVESLAPDTDLTVVAQVGYWLEVVSRRGQRGFVLAQDAVQVNK